MTSHTAARSGLWSRDEAGIALVEVLITAVVMGIAAVGIALMFATGSGWVSAEGDDRVAMKLAQQKVEQLRSMSFGCIFAGGPGSYPTPLTGCTAAQNYNEGPGNNWVDATGASSPQPAPTNKTYTRKTCVQYVNDTSVSSPAYTGGANPTAATCVPGNPTNVKRIVVVVQPTRATATDPPVILHAWITAVPGGI
jgi:type II secretory pathway pseudopilin PulG